MLRLGAPTMSVFTTTLVAGVLFIAVVNLVLGAQAMFQLSGPERRVFAAAGPIGVTLFALAWFVSILNPLAFAYMRVASGYAAVLALIGFSLDLLFRASPTARKWLLLATGVLLVLSVTFAWRVASAIDGLDLRTLYPRAVCGPLLFAITAAGAAGMRSRDELDRRFHRRVFIAALIGIGSYLLIAASILAMEDGAVIDPAMAALGCAEALTFVYAFRRRAEAREVLSRLLTYVLLAAAVAVAAGYAFYRLGYPSDPVLVTVTVAVALVSSVFFLALSERITRFLERSLFPDHASLRQHLNASRGEVATLRRRLQDVERLAVAGELAAKVAHEVKNPLAAVRGYAQLMSGSVESLPAELREGYAKGLRVICEESDRIDAQIRELLTLGQRKGPASRDMSCEINHVLVEAIAVAEGDSSGARFEVELESGAGCVHGSADELRGALVNILKNAAESCASRRGVRVRVTVRTQGEQLSIDVLDDGDGIAAEANEKMFSAFFTTKAAGTGLGLCIAKSAVEAAGGMFTLTNRSDSRGARATVTLERLTAARAAEAA